VISEFGLESPVGPRTPASRGSVPTGRLGLTARCAAFDGFEPPGQRLGLGPLKLDRFNHQIDALALDRRGLLELAETPLQTPLAEDRAHEGDDRQRKKQLFCAHRSSFLRRFVLELPAPAGRGYDTVVWTLCG